jgi:hypothetical protein
MTRKQRKGAMFSSSLMGFFLGGGAVAGVYPILLKLFTGLLIASGVVAGNIFTLSVVAVVAACVAGAVVGALIGWGVAAAIGFLVNKYSADPKPKINVVPVSESTHKDLLNKTFKFTHKKQSAIELVPEEPELKVEEKVLPEWAHCPITGKVMKEPVMNWNDPNDNRTYEKAAILAVELKKGMKSQQEIENNLVPNRRLEELIQLCEQDEVAIEDVMQIFNDIYISFEPIKNPVVCSVDGQTYEIKEITEWMAEHRTAPSSGVNIGEGQAINNVLKPNVALQNAMDYYSAQVKKLEDEVKLEPSSSRCVIF